jgi:hypothetical protein
MNEAPCLAVWQRSYGTFYSTAAREDQQELVAAPTMHTTTVLIISNII